MDRSREGAVVVRRALHAVRWGLLAVALSGCVKPHPVAPEKATLKSFALYALLEPMIEGDSPPRWADPSESFDCEAQQVTVDGAPLDIGTPVRQGSFTVRWHMQRCKALDDYTQFTGDIVMRVQASGATYRAVVEPAQFEVVCPYGREVWTEPFEARMIIRR